MTRSAIECSKNWAESLKVKVNKGKLYIYKDNVPSKNPIMFKV